MVENLQNFSFYFFQDTMKFSIFYSHLPLNVKLNSYNIWICMGHVIRYDVSWRENQTSKGNSLYLLPYLFMEIILSLFLHLNFCDLICRKDWLLCNCPNSQLKIEQMQCNNFLNKQSSNIFSFFVNHFIIYFLSLETVCSFLVLGFSIYLSSHFTVSRPLHASRLANLAPELVYPLNYDKYLLVLSTTSVNLLFFDEVFFFLNSICLLQSHGMLKLSWPNFV